MVPYILRSGAAKNNSNNSITLYPYGLIRRAGEPETIDFFVLHEGPLGVFDGTLSEKSYGDLTEAGKKGINIKPNESGGWIGLTDKYWLTALLPDQNKKYNSEAPTYISRRVEHTS